MKTKFEFNSEVESDNYDLQIFKQSNGMFNALNEMVDYFRKIDKHGLDIGDEFTPESVRSYFYEVLSDNKVDLDIF